MCLINRVHSKSLFIAGQISLLLFFLLQLPARHYPTFHPHLIDTLRGFLLGITIGLFIVNAWKGRRRMAQ